MKESLRQKQSRFCLYVSLLIDYAYRNGYELTFAEAFRTPEQAELNAEKGTGIARSLHCERLAIDLNLFRNGKYLTSTEAHRPLGEYWESLAPDNRWGGRFRDSKGNAKPDGNHYSLSPDGRRA